MGLGFVKGFELKTGAIASTIAHDSHNIVVIGTNEEDLLRIARLNSLRAFQQEKHYIQTIALRSIYASTNDLAFKGGTCLWFFHGLNRFSEDLDFTLVAKELELKDLPVEVKKDLEVYGIDSEIRILKDDGISVVS